MSRQYDNTNRGVLFKNDDKDDERSPDYTGSLNVDGAEFFLDAWIKEAKSGRKFLSVRVKPKQQRQPPQRRAPTSRNDDEPPF